MAVKQEVVITFNADTSGVEKNISQVEKGVQDTSKATSGLTNQFDKMTGGAVTGFAKMGQGLKTAVGGFKSLRVAVAATGIGLLIVAFTSLLSFFTKTERGAQQLRKITATLGAVMDKVADVAILLGEKLFAAFQNPQQAIKDFANLIKENIVNRFEGMLELIPQLGKAIGLLFEGKFGEAAKTAADAAAKVTLGVEDITDKLAAATQAAKDYAAEVARVAQEAANLAQRENDLKVAEREFLTVRAETNKLIAEKRLLVEDEKLSFKERIEALDEALAAEQRTIDKELEFAKERAAILDEQAALAESDEDTKQAVAEAEAQVIELQTRSLKAQKRLEGERQSLLLQKESREKAAADAAVKRDEAEAVRIEKQEAEAEKARLKTLEAQQKLQDELYAETLNAQEREELALMQKYDDRVAIAGDDEGLLRAATERLQADLAAIEQKYLDQKEKAEEDARDKEQKAKDEAAAKDKARRDKEREEELATAEAIKKAKLDIAKSSLDALAALNQAFTGESEEQQKKGFERSKKIQTAQALISTYESAVQAFKSLAGIPVVGPGLGAAAAAAATAAGLANVKQIQSQQYQSATAGGGGAGYSSAGSSAASGAQQAPTAPTLDLSFLGQGAGQSQPIQAYVLAQNVSNAQQANQKIQDQATL